jgi:predicted nucleotidyltransferase
VVEAFPPPPAPEKVVAAQPHPARPHKDTHKAGIIGGAAQTSRCWSGQQGAMTIIATPAPLVTREALQAFTRRLVEHFAPESVILFGSQARGEARWDSDADILVVMPFEGRPLDTVRAMRSACNPEFPLDLHLRRPEEIEPRYRWGDPFIGEALDHGEILHGELLVSNPGPMPQASPTPGPREPTPARNPVVVEWIERAERHWRMLELSADLPPGACAHPSAVIC